MKAGKVMRWISLGMLIVAIGFVYCGVMCPTLGRTFYIGSFYVDFDVQQAFYKGYVIVMCALFVFSFFFRKKKDKK